MDGKELIRMVAERQKAIKIVNDGMQTLPMEKVFAVRDFVVTITKERAQKPPEYEYAPKSVEEKQKAYEGLMEFCGSVELPEDRDAAKEEYLRSKYESLN